MYGINMNIEQILLHFLETDIIKIQICLLYTSDAADEL